VTRSSGIAAWKLQRTGAAEADHAAPDRPREYSGSGWRFDSIEDSRLRDFALRRERTSGIHIAEPFYAHACSETCW